MTIDLDVLEGLVARTVVGTVWVHDDGEIHRAYTVEGEPLSDAVASGLATGLTDTPDAEAICGVMNAASDLIAAARERDGLREALQRIFDLGSDGEHSGDRHARCRDIARQALQAGEKT